VHGQHHPIMDSLIFYPIIDGINTPNVHPIVDGQCHSIMEGFNNCNIHPIVEGQCHPIVDG
jgi:hypothetical protein